jgi:protein O-mannosyl-transferase
MQKEEFYLKDLFVPFTNTKAIVIIFVIGISVFLNGLFNGFVGDDASQITENFNIHSLQNIPSFFLGSTFYSGGGQALFGAYYKPMLSIVYALIYSLSGPNPFGFHLFQILLYLVNACLLFLFLKSFFRKEIAFILSLIFLVHPINNEAIFYISDMQNALFFFFGIMACLILQKYRTTKAMLVSSFFLFCSLLSKETGILFFAVLTVYIFIDRRKLFYQFLGYLSVTFLIYLILRIYAIGFFKPTIVIAPIQKLDLLGRIVNMPAIFLFYLKTFLFPLDLSVSYHWIYSHIDLRHFTLPLVIDLLFLAVIIYGAYLIRNKFSGKLFNLYIFFASWFLLGILFHLQIIPLDQTVADRWFYFAMVGILGMFGVFLEGFKLRYNKLFIVMVTGIICLLLTRTFARSFDWKSALTLAGSDLKVSREAFNLENGLSAAYFEKGKFANAEIHAKNSINISPNMFNYTNLGAALFCLEKYKESEKANLTALQYGKYYKTYENLAGLSLAYGDPLKNIGFIKNTALRIYPYDSTLWFYLAVLEYMNGQVQNAKIDIRNAYIIDQGSRNSFIYNVIVNDKQLKLRIKNGQINYISS